MKEVTSNMTIAAMKLHRFALGLARKTLTACAVVRGCESTKKYIKRYTPMAIGISRVGNILVMHGGHGVDEMYSCPH